MIEEHKQILEQYWKDNAGEYQYKYPDMFDPKWTIMESGWPWFRLSSLDDQPWKEMYLEAEALMED
jgi:hypothetical protein